MKNSSMETRSRNTPADGKDDPNSNGNSSDAPSGFILKLYQMVNGAPDEVISWTPAGDAFVIGSDLKRLESETLPQYFRHNRFQSLVRQLNFYSFRKINRERNVWIYKHELFHRDRPEDLHLVRRRTCPGLDGRKQRFSRFSARKLTDNVSSSGSDDESSVEQPNDMPEVHEEERKRPFESTVSSSKPTTNESASDVKRPRRLWNEATQPQQQQQHQQHHQPPKENLVVDTSLLMADTSEEKVVDPDEGASQTSPMSDRMEIAEQSLSVSEVAKKLEEYARRAYGPNTSKGRRFSGAGVVTPTYGSATSGFMSSLLTYDDEYEVTSTPAKSSSGLEIVSDVEDSVGSPSSPSSASSSKHQYNEKPLKKKSAAASMAVVDSVTARAIAARVLSDPAYKAEAQLIAFWITLSPANRETVSRKILGHLEVYADVTREFVAYRAALGHDTLTMPQIWARDSSRRDAIRDFQTFSVNCIQKVLGDDHLSLTSSDKAVLERSLMLWSKAT